MKNVGCGVQTIIDLNIHDRLGSRLDGCTRTPWAEFLGGYKMGESMIFNKSWYDAIQHLEPLQRLQIYEGIFEYAFEGKEIDLNSPMKCIIPLLKPQIDKNAEILYTKAGRHTGKYAEWRRQVFERDNYTCQHCGKKGVSLNAHHIKEYAKFPELRYDIRNGVTLCEKCHKKIHRKKA